MERLPPQTEPAFAGFKINPQTKLPEPQIKNKIIGHGVQLQRLRLLKKRAANLDAYAALPVPADSRQVRRAAERSGQPQTFRTMGVRPPEQVFRRGKAYAGSSPKDAGFRVDRLTGQRRRTELRLRKIRAEEAAAAAAAKPKKRAAPRKKAA